MVFASLLRRSACVRYPTGNVSSDPCLKSGTERANKFLFADVMRKNNFRHALEQVPFQIANTSRCAMMAPLSDQRRAGFALRRTRWRIFVGCRIRQSHEADRRQSLA